jgi:hypothetical protein
VIIGLWFCGWLEIGVLNEKNEVAREKEHRPL